MKIYDCFMFFDEEMMLDLRLNIMNQYVDKFIITEAKYMHSGKPKRLLFDINKFSKFKDKIIYNIVEEEPPNIEKLNETDSNNIKNIKLINNSNKREHYQREMAKKILNKAEPDDIILINDIDEIPNLENINFKNINEKIIIFKQNIYCYKFNLNYENLFWHGTKACRKKYFLSPQWLRDVRHKKYPLWRFDILFSKKKFNNIRYIENGGWHFTNIKSPQDIQKKFLNFLHHAEFQETGYNLDDLKKMIDENRILYDLSVDQRNFKWKGVKKLKKVEMSVMPKYLFNNLSKYSDWIET